MNRIFGLMMILLTLASANAVAQESSAKKWTLQECVNHAIENNLTVQRSRLDLQGREVNLAQSKADIFPTLNLGGSYGWSFGRSIDRTTNLFASQTITSSGISGNSSATLFAGKQKMNTIKQSELDLQSSNFNLEQSKQNVTLDVITFYLNVIFNRELVGNANYQLQTSQEQLKRTTRLVEAGSLPISDQFDLESQNATNELNVATAKNNLATALLSLKQVLQIPANEAFDIEIPELELDNYAVPTMSVGAVYDVAEQTQPSVKSADLGIESSIMGLKVAKGASYPSVSVNGSLSTNYSDIADQPRQILDGTTSSVTEPIGFLTNDPSVGVSQTFDVPNVSEVDPDFTFSEQFDENFGQGISLNLSIPVFNGHRTKAGIQRAIIANKQAEITSKEVRNNLRQTIELAYNDAGAAQKTFEARNKQVTSLEESFRNAEKRFNLGAVNFTDYQIAQNNLFQARTDLVRAKYDYIFKLKILDFYQGKPISF